jgi:FtsX-like permease family
MVNSAEGLLARALLRRYWVATVVLGLFAGLAGGAALGVWGIARRTSTVYDRFVAYEDAASLVVFGCFEGVDGADIDANYREVCNGYDYADLLAFLETVPEVDAAGRSTLAIANVAPADSPERGWRQLVPTLVDPGGVRAVGVPIVVAGRLADPDVATEATINEEASDRSGVGVGDQLIITPYRLDEFDLAGEGIAPPGGEETTVTVVGITRRPGDLAGRLGGRSIYEDTSAVTVGPAWWSGTGGDVSVYGVGVTVNTAPGSTNEDVIALIREQWPQRLWQFDTGTVTGSGGDQQTVRDAIRLQALGLFVIAVVIAVAGTLFAGQAVSRQSRREWSDASVLDALGMTRGGMIAAGAVRATALAVVAVAVALVVTIAVSPLGPVGIGRAAEPHPGIDVDGVVLTVGLPLVALTVLAFALVPIAMLRRQSSEPSPRPTSRTLSMLPPPGVAGWAMANSRRTGRLALGSAVIGVGFAAAAGIAAWSLVTSYDELLADPARYGSTWDTQVGNVGDKSQQVETRERLASIPDISAVGIRSLEGIGENPDFVLFAGEPFLGDATFGAITSGRAPSLRSEIALGSKSLDEFGVSIGERVTFTDPGDASSSFSFDVVGEVVVNAAISAQPGVGGLVTTEAIDVLSAETLSQNYVVWVDDGADVEATLGALRDAFPTTYVERNTPSQVTNLGLVSGQPALLALVVAFLAGAALIHALVTSVRGSRRQIGVWKSVGFTNRQVMSMVAWHASLLSAGALVIGIPLGIIVGRVIWRAIVDDIGLVSAPALPVGAVVVVAVVVLAVANLAALGPGWSAARTRAATALRTE